MAVNTEIPVGGLDAVDPNAEPIVAGTGAIKDPGLTIGGLKGVKLAPDDSAVIRGKLQEMIDAREAQKGGFDAWLGHMQSYGGKPGDFIENRRNYESDVVKREGELFGMRTQLAQLNTAERLAQQKAVEDQQFYQGITSMAGGVPQQQARPAAAAPQAGGLPTETPQAGGLPAAAPQPQAAGPAPILSPQQAAVLGSMYRTDPMAARKELWKMMASTEASKDARTIGLTPGTPEYNQYILARTAPEAIKPVQLPNPKTGFLETRPGFAVAGDILNPGRAPAPAPAGALPQVQPTGATPAAPVQPAGVTPVQPTGAAGNLPPEQAAQIAVKQAEARVAAEQTKQTELAKAEAGEEQALKVAAAGAPNDFIIAARIAQNVEKYPTLAGKLAQPTIASAIGNAVQQGLKTPYGSIGIDSVNDIATQLDPQAAKIKNPAEREARMTAARELAQDFATLALRGSKMIQGQGAVSDNERNLIKLSVGDISRLTPTNVVKIAKVIECEAANAQERNALWTTAENKGLSWKQFLRSPEYNNMLEKQYYETAKALKIQNPPKFNPAYEGRYSPTTVAPLPVDTTAAPATANKAPISAARQKLLDELKK